MLVNTNPRIKIKLSDGIIFHVKMFFTAYILCSLRLRKLIY